jgi:hypothetical protein
MKRIQASKTCRNQILGTARTIGILVNPRYTHFVNATAHRGAHVGT